MNTPSRRYHEIDALRIIALALLIIYHIFISYQPFAEALVFLQYDQLLDQYWFIAELMNVWRIPVLFVISGMALGFMLKRRTVRALVEDRMMRLVPPLVFGFLVICPVFPAVYTLCHGGDVGYWPNPGHLWFLINLAAYSILLVPLILMVKKQPDHGLIRFFQRIVPVGLLVLFPLALGAETALSKPDGFAFFPTRFWYGMVCYAAGFLFLSIGDVFWVWLRKVCHLALPVAVLMYLWRMAIVDIPLDRHIHWMTGIESGYWMLVFLGYGSLLLNKPIKSFGYLNKAVFPVYIIHMPVQQLVAAGIFGWKLNPGLTFLLHVVLTFVVCGALYEGVIRRLPWLFPVMGLKRVTPVPQAGQPPALPSQPSPWTQVGRILTLYVLAPVVVLPSIFGGLTAGFFDERQQGALSAEAANRIDIPEEPTAFRDHYYQVFEVESSILWLEAKARCEAMGGHLVIINDAEENEFLTTIGTGNAYYHLGASDHETEGVWRWVDGTPFTYENWHANEPNNFGGDEDYLNALHLLWPKWNDAGEKASGFVCEWDTVPDPLLIQSVE